PSAHGGDRQHPLELLRQPLWRDLDSHPARWCLCCARILHRRAIGMSRCECVCGSAAEDVCMDLVSETLGAEKAGYLYSQYPFFDIYQNSRYADFLLENGGRKVAIEIDDESSHNKSLVASNKFYDDLLKQNSMIYLGWDVYRWAVRQMQIQPEAVKDELRVFLGSQPRFREIEDYLPTQRGKTLDGAHLELKQHQREALDALQAMRDRHET